MSSEHDNDSRSTTENELTISDLESKNTSPPEIATRLQEQKRERERIREFGHVRPMIWSDYAGYRSVVVGSRIYRGRHWKTFLDFLHRYCFVLLGSDWHTREREHPQYTWHPLVQWDQDVRDFYRRVSGDLKEGELFSAVATAPVMARAVLAYDLYILEHHDLLRPGIIKRLKDINQFQGAKYEVYVAVSFVRAGFEVEPENETDRTTSHCEFTATHRTGVKYSVEAKSRHRQGILGREGVAPSFDAIVSDVSTLLVKALRKHSPHQRIAFIDVNVPPHEEPVLKSDWFRQVARQLRRLEETVKGGDALPPAFLFLTNHAHHYVSAETPEPGKAAIFTGINIPDFKRGPNTGVEASEQKSSRPGHSPKNIRR